MPYSESAQCSDLLPPILWWYFVMPPTRVRYKLSWACAKSQNLCLGNAQSYQGNGTYMHTAAGRCCTYTTLACNCMTLNSFDSSIWKSRQNGAFGCHERHGFILSNTICVCPEVWRDFLKYLFLRVELCLWLCIISAQQNNTGSSATTITTIMGCSCCRHQHIS